MSSVPPTYGDALDFHYTPAKGATVPRRRGGLSHSQLDPQTWACLTDALRALAARGLLCIDDPDLAAERLTWLVGCVTRLVPGGCSGQHGRRIYR